MLTINEDLLGLEAIEEPYTYYGRLREEDPIHWNPLYETWVITRYDDVVWFLRHPEFFSSEIFLRDPHPPLPPILDTDQALYEFNKKYLTLVSAKSGDFPSSKTVGRECAHTLPAPMPLHTRGQMRRH